MASGYITKGRWEAERKIEEEIGKIDFSSYFMRDLVDSAWNARYRILFLLIAFVVAGIVGIVAVNLFPGFAVTLDGIYPGTGGLLVFFFAASEVFGLALAIAGTMSETAIGLPAGVVVMVLPVLILAFYWFTVGMNTVGAILTV